MKKSTQRIEAGLRELLTKTQANNEALISRATVLNKLQSLISTLLLSTRRRLTGKLNPNRQATLDAAFQKFNDEIQEAIK